MPEGIHESSMRRVRQVGWLSLLSFLVLIGATLELRLRLPRHERLEFARSVRAPGAGRARESMLPVAFRAASGRVRAVEALLPLASASIELQVLSRAGTPIERYAVGTIAVKGAEVLAFQPESPRPAGRSTLAVPAQDFQVEVRASGWRPARLGPFAFASPPPRLEFRLDPAGGVSGTVETKGRPLAGARVGLYEVAATRETYNGFPLRTRREPVLESECGKNGSFSLAVECDGTYVLRAEAEGYAPAEAGPGRAPADRQHEEHIELGLGGQLEARVRSASGASVAGRLVAITRGDGLACTQRSEADGRTLFSGLSPGRWQVELSEQEIDPSLGSESSGTEPAGPIPSNCSVFEGEVTRVDLGVELDGACQLSGRLAIDAQPATAWLAGLDPEGAAMGAPRTLLEPGLFRLSVDEPGRYRLSLHTGGADPGAMHVIRETLDLPEGEQFWSLEFETAGLEGALANSGSTLVFHRWQRGALECFTPLVPGADGRFRVRVPAGRGTLVRLEPDRPMEEQTPVVLREVELEAGQALSVE